MKKMLVLATAVLVLMGACAIKPPVQQAPNPGSPQGAVSVQPSAPQDTFLFAGKTLDQLFVAAKMALTECGYTIKNSDRDSGLLLAAKAAEPNAPMATVLAFTDKTGSSGLKIQFLQAGQAGSSSSATQEAIDKILAAVRQILR